MMKILVLLLVLVPLVTSQGDQRERRFRYDPRRPGGVDIGTTSDGQEGYEGAVGGQQGFPYLGGFGYGPMHADGGMSRGLQFGYGSGHAAQYYRRRRTGENVRMEDYFGEMMSMGFPSGLASGGDLPGGGVSGGGMSGMGTPGGRMSAMGIPSGGMSGMGIPGGGMSAMGMPSGGMPGLGSPGLGMSGLGMSGMGLPGGAMPGLGLPGGGMSGSAMYVGGIPGMGISGSGTPGMRIPGVGLSGGGIPGGIPGVGMSGGVIRPTGGLGFSGGFGVSSGMTPPTGIGRSYSDWTDLGSGVRRYPSIRF